LNRTLTIAAALMVVAGASAQVYSNGTANGVNGVRPTANWDPQGIIHDFTVTAGNQSMGSIRIEMIDLTNPVGTFSTPDDITIEFYDLAGPGTVQNLVHGVDVPFYTHTYTMGSGEMVKSFSGFQYFGGDLEYWDLTTAAYNFASPGHFAMFFWMPGTGPEAVFIASSVPAVAGDPGSVFGPGINSVLTGDNAEGAFTINAVPEPSTFLAVFAGLGLLVASRRRK